MDLSSDSDTPNQDTSKESVAPAPPRFQLFSIHCAIIVLFQIQWISLKLQIFSNWTSFFIIGGTGGVCSFASRQLCVSYYTKEYIYKYGEPKRDHAKEVLNQYVAEQLYLRIIELLITLGLALFALLGLIFTGTRMYQVGFYMISLSAYHFLEYSFGLLFHFSKVHPNSFLINQSQEYGIAISVSFIEYFLELFGFSSMKLNTVSYYITIVGVLLVLVGHYFRAGAEFTARSNFTHEISFHKKENHKLVTHGVYSISRHPGYFGWYLWSGSTQLMMINPVGTVGFYLANYHFFKNRIEAEEELLESFFGKKYSEYKKKVPIRIPFLD